MKTLSISAVIAALTASTALAAFDVNTLDTDNDGVASKAEVQALFPALSNEDFLALDLNGNGAIDANEITAEAQGLFLAKSAGGASKNADAVADILRSDTDSDGLVSKAELQIRYPQLSDEEFAVLDQNGDGFADADELFTEASATVVAKYIPGNENPSTSANPGPVGNATVLSEGAIVEVPMFDTDGDGFASRDEIVARFPDFDLNQFGQIDPNSDNRVSYEEMAMTEAQSVLRIYLGGGTPVVEVEMFDTDGDGFASEAEIRVAFPDFDPNLFGQMDQNGDSRISHEEMNQADAQNVLKQYQ